MIGRHCHKKLTFSAWRRIVVNNFPCYNLIVKKDFGIFFPQWEKIRLKERRFLFGGKDLVKLLITL
ncbi:hypothetical protein JOC27_000292 [Sporolactobacillus spathodeae]|uniref:Uncharacterized protein n=1 Tax=Sporolactobacillus spathodeae TaxID=1465502 RepID=A0ABS2Q6B0_9BACL|nr:hypothetical protein [Sporolactobacillus spathodeae]